MFIIWHLKLTRDFSWIIGFVLKFLMWQGLEGRAERVAEQKRSFCGAMEAEAGTLESLVLVGELCEPGKSRPKRAG